MGRKPNQLVLEYFDRGARLTDNSNRYEQRCKACGENFPKGRAENLIIHIESKCPAIRREDQARLLINHPYSTPPSTADGEGNVPAAGIGHVDNSNGSTGLHTVLPVSSRRNLTGLEALAEASRQLTHPVNQGTELPPPRHQTDPLLEKAHPDVGNGPRRDETFGILASWHRDRWKIMEFREPVECFARFCHAERDVPSFNLAARGDLQQYVSQESRASEQHPVVTPESIPLLDDPTEQISAKLLAHMLAAISHPMYKITSPLIGPTILAALKLIQQGDLPPDVATSPTKGWAPETRTQDKLLALSLDLWALTQVIVSGSNDWRLSLTASELSPENHQPTYAQADSAIAPGAELSASAGVLSQLKAAAEQRAAFISRNVMIELEKRLERKEKCRGFETFLVGILLLNCVERMSWTMKRVSMEEDHQQWPLEQPVEHYLDQAAHFAEFLSKLYRMRGILLHLRRPAEEEDADNNDDDDDNDAILQPAASSANAEDETVRWWLRELRLTGKVLEERRAATRFDPDGSPGDWDFRFCTLLLVVEEEERESR
ncbi:MAG: hypothetical protein Q9202_000635 [Teloschistes flavicans]